MQHRRFGVWDLRLHMRLFISSIICLLLLELKDTRHQFEGGSSRPSQVPGITLGPHG
jgi:hypothetical protein